MSLQRSKKVSAILASASLAFLLAGCGAGDSNTEASEISEDCEPKHEFSTINEGVLTVAAFNSPPKFHALSDRGPYEGIDADLISQFAEENCLEVNFKPLTGPAAQLDLADGNSDVMGGLILKSEERAKVFNQTESYITLETVGVTSSEGFDSVESLQDHSVGVISGSTYAEPLKEAIGADNVEEYQSDSNAFEDLTAGRIDAIVWQTMQGVYHSESNDEYPTEVIQEDSNYPILTGMLENNWPHAKGNDELTVAIDAFYDQVKDDGTLAEVLVKHGFKDPDLYIQGRS